MAESPHCVLEPELDGQDESVRGRTAGIVVITPTELASETEFDVSRIRVQTPVYQLPHHRLRGQLWGILELSRFRGELGPGKGVPPYLMIVRASLTVRAYWEPWGILGSLTET